MTVVTRKMKIYFGAVGLFALWVGIWGYFVPGEIDRAIPWLVPPLHARFLGAMYLSGATFMLGGILAQTYAEVRVMVRVIAIWTGMLFVVSLLYLEEFDYSRLPVWFWFGAYLVYPLIAIWLMWFDREGWEKRTVSGLPGWARGNFQVQGVLVTVLALLLLFMPERMVIIWPWKITPLLAQIYSAPFLAYGVSSWMLSRQRNWLEVRVVVWGIFMFALEDTPSPSVSTQSTMVTTSLEGNGLFISGSFKK